MLALASPGCRWGRAFAGSECAKDRGEPPHDVGLAADHQAVATLEPGDAAARPDIHVVDPARLEFPTASHVVAVEGVAAIDDGVAGLEQWHHFRQLLIHDGRWHHQPDGARPGQSGG